MRALVQRVQRAEVRVAGERVGSVGPGLCVFVGVTHSDAPADAARLARRIWRLRIFDDAEGRANLSAGDLGLAVLLVSQFTLYADTSRGRRPSYARAAPPELAEPLVEAVAAELRAMGAEVATGIFGAEMQVDLVDDGPFTLSVES